MQVKKIILSTFILFSFSSQAFDTASQIRKDDDKLNSFSFSSSNFNEDIVFCNQILEPICKGKNCKSEEKIQTYINDSCKAAANDKLSLMEDYPNTPMGPIAFFPKSYSGFAVFLSRFQDLLKLNPDINETQYVMYVDYFKEIKDKYIQFDNKNIKTSFTFTGKYLEDKSNNKKPMKDIAHKWVTCRA